MRKSNLLVMSCLLAVMATGCGSNISESNTAEAEAVAETNTETNTETNAEPVAEAADQTSDSAENSEVTEQTADTEGYESSPFLLWEHEGYVDECAGYSWQDEFKDCDYDDDGLSDRVSRSWQQDDETAIYTIEFGNGDKLVTPVGWETGFPHVQSGDLDSDGVKEILVTLSYDTSTDPYSFGDMWLFDKDEASREYKEVELPLAKTENGGKGYEVEYDKPVDGKITFNVKEAGLSMTEEVGDDYLSNWWSDDYTSETRVVYYAEINGTDNPVLRCYIEPIHRWPLELGFNLNYNNGKYEAGYIEIDDPYTP